MLPIVAFALNNAVNASNVFTLFYVNGLTHPRVPITLTRRGSEIGGGEMTDQLANTRTATVNN